MKMTRHVPSEDIRRLGDIGFEEELHLSEAPREDYDSRRWLFVPCAYTEYRYLLGTRGDRPLICVGINPSTARPDALDPTLKSVERIALHAGYDSFIMMNVYPQRATDANDIEKECYRTLHEENMKAFSYALTLSDTVWAAWGNLIEKRPFLRPCLRDMIGIGLERGAKWVRCGKVSVKGHPHHPLYLPHDEPLMPFDAAGYLEKL